MTGGRIRKFVSALLSTIKLMYSMKDRQNSMRNNERWKWRVNEENTVK